MRAMRFNEESALRSRHSVFERRKQSDRSKCSIALREAQSGEIKQDFVDCAVDFRWGRYRPAHSKAFWLFVRIAKKFCSWFKRVSAKRSSARRRRTLRAVSYWTSETLTKRGPRLISPFNGKRIQ